MSEETLHRILGGVLVALLLLGPTPVSGAGLLVPLACPGPWSGISGLIGYGDRLWFVNSVKFVNHNSADLYGYDPVTGQTRYEGHLFSQDAGQPVVAGELLYWPFEDARFSTGRGEYLVTNARASQWRILPHGEVFHIHAMATHHGALFAATSAWRGGVQRSDDGGVTWRVIYDHPTPPGLVSRVTSLAVLDDALYAGLTAIGQEGAKLLKLAGDVLRPVPGWPRGDSVSGLTAYRGWLYGVSTIDTRSAVWRTNGRTAERVTGLVGEAVRAFAAGPAGLWAVTAQKRGGALWRSADGRVWRSIQRFEGAEPVDVTVYAGGVYVGTIGPAGRGTLWGPPPPSPAEPSISAPLLPRPPRQMAPTQVPAALATVDLALSDESSYVAHGARLRSALEPLAFSNLAEVGVELVRRLGGPFPGTNVRLFGGALTVPAATLARWYLLWAIGLNGHGRIPPELLSAPWTAQPNRAEKYLEPTAAAAWAMAQLGQRDPRALAALMAGLGAPEHPSWLDGDFVGALSALTGEHFGYDLAAWHRWWAGVMTGSR